MKTTLKRILMFITAALMLLSLASCDKSGSIKKAFEKENYEVASIAGSDEGFQSALAWIPDLTEEQKEAIKEYEIIAVNKKEEASTNSSAIGSFFENLGNAVDGAIPDAVIVKFPSAGDLKDFLTIEKDGEKDTTAYDKAKEAGQINGNCWMVLGDAAAKEIFK